MEKKPVCSNCGNEMQLTDITRRTYRLDPSQMTDGQMAEQYAADMGGPWEAGIHGETVARYRCDSCGRHVESN